MQKRTWLVNRCSASDHCSTNHSGNKSNNCCTYRISYNWRSNNWCSSNWRSDRGSPRLQWFELGFELLNDFGAQISGWKIMTSLWHRHTVTNSCYVIFWHPKHDESYTFECFDSDEVANNEQKCTLTAENGFVFHGALSKNHQVVTFKESLHWHIICMLLIRAVPNDICECCVLAN